MSREFVCRCPTEENSHEVAPTVLAHTSPTVVSAAVTALLKITVGHLVGLCSFAIWGGGETKREQTLTDILLFCSGIKYDPWNSLLWVINIFILALAGFKLSLLLND